MADYILKDYRDISEEDTKHRDFSKVKVSIITESEMWELLQNKEEGLCIYQLGDCIIDWS